MRQKRLLKNKKNMRTRKIFLLLGLLLATMQGAWADDNVMMLEDDNGTKYVNMPKQGSGTLTLTDANVTTFKVYDDGGPSGHYSDNCDGTLVLTVPTGYLLQLTGTVSTSSQPDPDYLSVYDGGSTSASCLGTFNNGSQNVGVLRSSGQQLTLYFNSNNDVTTAGLDLTVRLIDSTPYNINGLGAVTGHKCKDLPYYYDLAVKLGIDEDNFGQ